MRGDLKLCDEAGCGARVKARGLCQSHYNKTRYSGSAMPLTKRDLKVSFFEQALQSNTDDCIDWPFGKRGDGYGRTYLTGNDEGAHVYVCRLAHGEKPLDKEEVAHTCGRPICINPKHLRWASGAENQADRILHGTHDRGERNVRSKLTDDAVREIRRLRGVETQLELARRFGVSGPIISKVQTGKTWRHIQ